MGNHDLAAALGNADGFNQTAYGKGMGQEAGVDSLNYDDLGSFSRYFDLDKWAQKTFPFLVVSKASKSEKNKGLDMKRTKAGSLQMRQDGSLDGHITIGKNNHPSVKPVKLMSYLITLGSREGDVVLDPFMGSGTTGVACQLLSRKFIGIDNNEEYCEIAKNRCGQSVMRLEI